MSGGLPGSPILAGWSQGTETRGLPNAGAPRVVPAAPGVAGRSCDTGAVPPPIFAHASGFSWDEALLVLAPLVVIGGILVLLNRRASRWQDDDQADGPASPNDLP